MHRSVLSSIVQVVSVHGIMQAPQGVNMHVQDDVSEVLTPGVPVSVLDESVADERNVAACEVCEGWPGVAIDWKLCDAQGGTRLPSRNNLGGQGPNTADPPEIRYDDVANINGVSVDLVVTNKSIYIPYDISRNITSDGTNDVGIHGCFGAINVASDTIVNLNFAFKIHGSDDALGLGKGDKFVFSVWDLDMGEGSQERVDFDTSNANPAATMANSGVTRVETAVRRLKRLAKSPNKQLKVCQGDCDRDSDCPGDSVCVKSDKDKKVVNVEGCTAGDSAKWNNNQGNDYCSNPGAGKPLVHLGPNPSNLEVCQGDCDKDSDCPGDSVCVQKKDSNKNTLHVEGCAEGDSAKYLQSEGNDYCSNPYGHVANKMLSMTNGDGSDNPSSSINGVDKSTEAVFTGSSTWNVKFEVVGGSRGRNFLFGGCRSCPSMVSCSLTADNQLKMVSYNGQSLTAAGNNNNWQSVKTITFEEVPGAVLAIKAKNSEAHFGAASCNSAGLMVSCISTNTASDWHRWSASTTNMLAYGGTNGNEVGAASEFVKNDFNTNGWKAPCQSKSGFTMSVPSGYKKPAKIWGSGKYSWFRSTR